MKTFKELIDLLSERQDWEKIKRAVDTQKKYAKLMNPIDAIIEDRDEVFIIYPDEDIDEVLSAFMSMYSEEEENYITTAPFNLGYAEPEKSGYEFAGKEYSAIMLWFDKDWDSAEKTLYEIRKIIKR